MKTAAIALFFTALITSAACASSYSRQKQNRYIYCNVYTSTLCFGIAAGDSSRMSIPSDFVLYEFHLANGVTGSFYSGYNPEKTDETLVAVRRDFVGDDGSYEYRSMKNGDRDIIYRSSRESEPIAHIRFHKMSDLQTLMAGDFLRNFRPCGTNGTGMNCTESRVFDELVSQQFTAVRRVKTRPTKPL